MKFSKSPLQKIKDVKVELLQAFDPSFSETEKWFRILLATLCIILLAIPAILCGVLAMIALGVLISLRTFKRGKNKKTT